MGWRQTPALQLFALCLKLLAPEDGDVEPPPVIPRLPRLETRLPQPLPIKRDRLYGVVEQQKQLLPLFPVQLLSRPPLAVIQLSEYRQQAGCSGHGEGRKSDPLDAASVTVQCVGVQIAAAHLRAAVGIDVRDFTGLGSTCQPRIKGT
jgi:hypothetical protein